VPDVVVLQRQQSELLEFRISLCAGKWMIAGGVARDGRLVVTNGCI
jgi:hypothetical protein